MAIGAGGCKSGSAGTGLVRWGQSAYLEGVTLRRIIRVLLPVVAWVVGWVLLGVWRGTGPEDARVQGRRVSAWLSDVCPRTPFSARMVGVEGLAWRTSVAALREAGTNALPWLVESAVAPASWWERWHARWLGMGSEVGLGYSWISESDRRAGAVAMLAELRPSGSALLALLEPSLRSGDSSRRGRAIGCLGWAGREAEVVVERLRPLLAGADEEEAVSAELALSRIGSAARLAVGELCARVEADRGVSSGLARALRACGSEARCGLAGLESRWERLKESEEKLELSLAILGIDPTRERVWAYLDGCAGGDSGTEGAFRAFAAVLDSAEVSDPRFVPYLLRGLDGGSGVRWLAGGNPAFRALHRMAPGEVARILAERIRTAESPGEAVAAADYWLRLDAANAEGRRVLLDSIRRDDATSLDAVVSLASHVEPFPEEAWEYLGRARVDRRLSSTTRDALGRAERWLRSRERQLGVGR